MAASIRASAPIISTSDMPGANRTSAVTYSGSGVGKNVNCTRPPAISPTDRISAEIASAIVA